MTTPTPRWTPETEATLHRALHDLDVRINNLTGDHHCNLVTQVALTALADAGVLTPPDIEPNRQYGRRRADGLLLATSLPDPTHYRLIGPWREVTDDPA